MPVAVAKGVLFLWSWCLAAAYGYAHTFHLVRKHSY